MSLDRDAGADTWLGARPLLCHNVLLANLMQVHGAVDDLRWHAWQLERRANEIDAAARLLQARDRRRHGDDMETAYDPARIQLLSTRTAQAVDELASIRCSDPAAADALRAVRLLRINLEDLWLPLLAQIRSSRAMITWLESTHDRIERGREMIVDWLEDHRRPDNEFARMSDDELIDCVTWFGFDALPFGDDGQLDMDDEFWSTSFTAFADVIAERVAREP